MLRQGAPEVGELLHEAVVFHQARFEVAVGMQIDDYSQAVIQNHLYGGVEICKIIGGNFVGTVIRHQGLGINAEADVIEAHRSNESDVLLGDRVLKVFSRIAPFIVDLREPSADIDATAQMGEPDRRNGKKRLMRKIGHRLSVQGRRNQAT